MMDVETGLQYSNCVHTNSLSVQDFCLSDFQCSLFQAKELKDRNKCLLYFRWLMLLSEVFVTCTDIHMLNL